ncbi:MAG TPA: hypothetical protein VGQ91_17000 [Ideonella sp.]|jgi:hypothetical protein|nr:hypothetical protein [Ideonella sp.]
MPNVSISVSTPGGISCSPDAVPAGTSPNVTITFTLQTTGYRFASSNAIVVPSPSNQFPSPSITVSSNQVTLFDVNSDQNTYKYVVNLVRTSDNQPLSVDPTILNGQ